jgi:hypothetical protein
MNNPMIACLFDPVSKSNKVPVPDEWIRGVVSGIPAMNPSKKSGSCWKKPGKKSGSERNIAGIVEKIPALQGSDK